MISLAQTECEHYERCRVHAAGGQPVMASACRICPNPPKLLAKVHPPAADLGVRWIAGRLVDSEGGHAD